MTTITFDEFELHYATSLSFNGVTIDFTINEIPEVAGFGDGPGAIGLYVTCPCIEARSSGVLTFTFDKPTTFVQFDVLVQYDGPLADRVTVDLYRPGNGILRETIIAPGASLKTLTEGRFSYSGPAVKTISVHISDLTGDYFLLDNLVFQG